MLIWSTNFLISSNAAADQETTFEVTQTIVYRNTLLGNTIIIFVI